MIRELQITRYITTDGTGFDDRSSAEAWEADYHAVKPIMARLRPTRDLPSGQYVQHDAKVLRKAKRDLFALVVARYGKSYSAWKSWDADDVHPDSIVGRVMSEERGPLAEAWNLLGIYDFQTGREYQQRYFTNNPDEATVEFKG